MCKNDDDVDTTGNKTSRNRQSESTTSASAHTMMMSKQAYIGSNKISQSVIFDRKNGTQHMCVPKDDDVKSNYMQVRTKK